MIFGVKLCSKCYNMHSELVLKGEEFAVEYVQEQLSSSVVPYKARKLFEDALSVKVKKDEERIRAVKIEDDFENMMLTTGNSFEGYCVREYIDVICEESIFRNSMSASITAGLEDLVESFSFSEKELSGGTSLIENARNFVFSKFKRKAASIGANGVLGIEFETSLGTALVRVSVFGTAVRIEKNNS